MLSLAEMGARIVPAMPGFYHRPKSIRDLIDMMVMRILDQMQLKASLSERWPSELNKEYRL
jgi:4-hydroxy-3-polyprenylbenzoate decarboxylase